MENVAQIKINYLTKPEKHISGFKKPRAVNMPMLLAFLRSIFKYSDLDCATFQRLESKRTPQEMRRNGLY